MFGIGGFIKRVVEIILAWLHMDVLLKQIISAMQSPPVKDLIIHTQLDAVRFAFEIILKVVRQRQANYVRRAVGSGAPYVIVNIVKS